MGLLQIIKMKSCIILFCLLAVVYSEGAGDDKSLKEHMNLIEAKADDAKDVVSSFFTNLLEPTSLKFLVAQLIEWFAWLLVTVILDKISLIFQTFCKSKYVKKHTECSRK